MLTLKKKILSLILFAGLTSAVTPTGIGVIFGEPTGISARLNIPVVLGMAWSLDDHFRVHGDYLIVDDPIGKGVNWYLGGGLKVHFFGDGEPGSSEAENDNDRTGVGMGIRIPLGMTYFFSNDRLELFGEIVPGMDLIPGTDIDLEGGIGIRYHFSEF